MDIERENALQNDFVYIEGKVPCYQSRLFSANGIAHAFFTKKGGVSTGVFESLNFSTGNGSIKDSRENVLKNHAIAASLFGLTVRDICRSVQTHTSTVETVNSSHRGKGLTAEPFDHGVDGMVTAEKNLLLSIRTADCVPVLLADKEGKAVGAVHAGWRGTVGGITVNAVEKMVELGARRENIIAAIGPCIANCCYEVGGELFEAFTEKNESYSAFFKPKGEKFMLDLVFANRFILEQVGIPPENISSADICTRCNGDRFFSHRLSGVDRGTMSAAIAIKNVNRF
ncbi:MAG: peptidoglycan editing factor PgeF [Clostridia bacterium]|nr:peptidoglycan editing factor PgeF [Clostridia bacterium]